MDTRRQRKRMHRKLKDSQQQLIQSEKLAVIGQLAVGVVHEINNPLFVISGEAEMLLKDKDKNTRDASRVILEQAAKIKEIIRGLLEFSRKRDFRQKPLDINNAVEKSISLLIYQAKIDGIEIIKELDPNLPKALGDSNQIQEVFLNIILNAVQAMEDGGRLTVRTRREKVTKYGKRKTDKFKLGAELIIIEFENTGGRIDKEMLKKIFDPFFSTKEKGTGLGLSICRRIIDDHKGDIEAQSKLGKGAIFIIKLPII